MAAASVLFGMWTLYVRPAVSPSSMRALTSTPANSVTPLTATPGLVSVANPYGGLNPRPRGALIDPGFLSAEPVRLAESFPLNPSFEPSSPTRTMALAEPENILPPPRPAGSDIPLPVRRPSDLGPTLHPPAHSPTSRLAQQTRRTSLPITAPDNRSFFEKLFGFAQPSGPALAYAAPETGAISNMRSILSNPTSRFDRFTAIYDVSAHTVYMPNGARLEAHSGLGNRIDDPHYVNEKMRGATPPNIYELQPREQLFHGVQALRLIPVGGGELFGRTGLLAHSYMLGPNGDSNGCVSFRDYNAFLRAFQNGEIRRLAVVAHLS